MTFDPNSREAHTQYHGHRSKHYGLVGPAILITIGAIFLVSEFFPGWGVGKTWPVILIVIGLARLAESILAQKSVPPSQQPERFPQREE